MYGLVFAAGIASLLLQKCPGLNRFDRRWAVGVFGFVAFVLSAWLWFALSIPYVSGVLTESGVELMGYFGIGMVAHAAREHVRLSGWGVVGGALLLAAIPGSYFYGAIFAVWLSYSCLWLSYTPSINARNFGSRGDMSYGINIFAFPRSSSILRYYEHVHWWELGGWSCLKVWSRRRRCFMWVMCHENCSRSMA